MSEVDLLREQLQAKEAELLNLKLELIDTKIQDLQRRDTDKETRLRGVEESRMRFETLAWLAFGGGAVSLINIFNGLIR